jgi:hypothetical protein
VIDFFEELDDDPTKEHIDHSTAGNAGISMERWYHRAALIIDLPEDEEEEEDEDEEEEEERKHKKVELHPGVIE